MKVTNGFLVATIAAAAGAAPDPNQLVISTEIPVGGGKIVESRLGTLMIVQPRRGSFIAYSARCTHSGCEVNQATATAIICTMPCGHGSQFSTSTGQVLVGPAREPLRKYEVVERNGMLFLN
jgi:nitrite reductase/ring-hydroxylating ferredoxin subunit